METAKLKVTGMTCGHCVKAVTTALQTVDGVSAVRVDLASGSAAVDYEGDRSATVAALTTAVMNEGYTAEEAT